MVGKTALNKEMKHLNGAYFRTIMATASGYPEISILISARIRLIFRSVRTVPIQAPLFHIPVHII